MKAEFIVKTAIAALVAGALSFGTAQADKPSWAGHGHGNPHGASSDESSDGDHAVAETHHGKRHHEHDKVELVEHDRTVIREYIGHHRDRWCPPGLAKKHNGCMPPGQLKYKVGESLPTTVRYQILPHSIVETLTPLPPDDIYVRTGGDVYIMNKTDRTILDAVTLLNDLR